MSAADIRPFTSTVPLRNWLGHDVDGMRLQALRTNVAALARTASDVGGSSDSAELRRRCVHLAYGAHVADKALPLVVARLAAHAKPSAASTEPMVDAVLLMELGWLALEVGVEREGFAVLHAIGTMLGGKLGGALFEVNALLALGRWTQAASTLEQALDEVVDHDGMPSAVLAMLWHATGDARWTERARHVLAVSTNPSVRALCETRLSQPSSMS